MERNHEAPEIPLRQLGGIDQRNSPIEVPPANWNYLQGLYPKKNGLLARLPGKKTLQIFDEAILSIAATGDRDNHVLVQTTSKLYIYRLDELLGTAQDTSNLEHDSTVVDDGTTIEPKYEENAGLILLAHAIEDAGTPLTIPTGSAWTDVPLSNLVLDEESSLNSFTPGSASFEVKSGYYWFIVTISGTSALGNESKLIARLYNTTTSLAANILLDNSPASISTDRSSMPTRYIGQFYSTINATLKVQVQHDSSLAVTVSGTAGMGIKNIGVLVEILRYSI